MIYCIPDQDNGQGEINIRKKVIRLQVESRPGEKAEDTCDPQKQRGERADRRGHRDAPEKI